jgi:hypothetical protein
VDPLAARQGDEPIAGKAAIKRNRFIQLSGGTRSVNRTLEARARALAATDGLDGFRESVLSYGGFGGGYPHFRGYQALSDSAGHAPAPACVLPSGDKRCRCSRPR